MFNIFLSRCKTKIKKKFCNILFFFLNNESKQCFSQNVLLTSCFNFSPLFQSKLVPAISIWFRLPPDRIGVLFLSINYSNEKFHSDLISSIICNVRFLLVKYWLMSAGSTSRKMVLAKLRPVMSSQLMAQFSENSDIKAGSVLFCVQTFAFKCYRNVHLSFLICSYFKPGHYRCYKRGQLD